MKGQQETQTRRVLIVDDEEGFRDGVADLLGMEGYSVSVARDAVDAVSSGPTSSCSTCACPSSTARVSCAG